MSSPPSKDISPGGDFYKFRDANGHVWVVDAMEKVPKAYKKAAQKLETKKPEFYSYEDASGHQWIVDSISEIPEKSQKLAKRVSLDDVVEKTVKSAKSLQEQAGGAIGKAQDLREGGARQAKELQREIGDVVPFVKDLDLPSVAVGFGLALTVVVVFSFVRRTGKLLIKVALVLAVVVLFSGAYLGWVRRSAGLGDTKLASPQEMIDDAKGAANKMKSRLKTQEKILKDIEESSK